MPGFSHGQAKAASVAAAPPRLQDSRAAEPSSSSIKAAAYTCAPLGHAVEVRLIGDTGPFAAVATRVWLLTLLKERGGGQPVCVCWNFDNDVGGGGGGGADQPSPPARGGGAGGAPMPGADRTAAPALGWRPVSDSFRAALRDGNAPAARRPESEAWRVAARALRLPDSACAAEEERCGAPIAREPRSRDAPIAVDVFSLCTTRRLAERSGRTPVARGGAAANAPGTDTAAVATSLLLEALRLPAVRTTRVRGAVRVAAAVGFASASREFTELTRDAGAEAKVRPEWTAAAAAA